MQVGQAACTEKAVQPRCFPTRASQMEAACPLLLAWSRQGHGSCHLSLSCLRCCCSADHVHRPSLPPLHPETCTASVSHAFMLLPVYHQTLVCSDLCFLLQLNCPVPRWFPVLMACPLCLATQPQQAFRALSNLQGTCCHDCACVQAALRSPPLHGPVHQRQQGLAFWLICSMQL